MATTPNPNLRASVAQSNDDDFVPVGVESLLAASSKLLNISRGREDPDDRDSWEFKTVLTPDRLLQERIRLDADKIRMSAVRNASRTRSLKGLAPGFADNYARGLLIGNPLSSPLEDINPMHVTEQNRRVTGFGPGGIGSADAITEEAQSIHPSQFGFISPMEGPESEKAGIDSRLSFGVMLGSDGNLYRKMRNRRTGKMEWVSHVKAAQSVIGVPD